MIVALKEVLRGNIQATLASFEFFCLPQINSELELSVTPYGIPRNAGDPS